MKFKTLMGRALVASVACGLAALFLVAVPAEAGTGATLRVSSDPGRGAARDLNGASLSGDAYVFLSGKNISSVTFTLDQSAAGSLAPTIEHWYPYDLAHTANDGKAYPFDTSKLKDGRHVVAAKVVATDGEQSTVEASFTVADASPAAPAPTQTPTAKPAPPTPTAMPTVTVDPTTPAPLPTVTVDPTPKPTPTPTATPTAAQQVQTAGSTIIDADFDAQAAGQVSPASFNKLLGDTNDNDASYDSMSYVDDTRGGKAVRTKLAANKYLGSGGSGDGTVLVVKLNRSTDSACMSYDVRFSSNFDFSAGGKIPGLLGVAPGTAPSTPTGGGSVAHGWSGRLMWLGPTSYSFAGEGGNDNMAVTVLYHPGQSTKWGDNVQWHKPFIDGKWHHVKQCYTMNTIGKSNGVLEAWFDGAQVVDRSDVLFRTDSNVHITHFDWSIFRGGSSMMWAGKSDGYVDMDNVVVTG